MGKGHCGATWTLIRFSPIYALPEAGSGHNPCQSLWEPMQTGCSQHSALPTSLQLVRLSRSWGRSGSGKHMGNAAGAEGKLLHTMEFSIISSSIKKWHSLCQKNCRVPCRRLTEPANQQNRCKSQMRGHEQLVTGLTGTSCNSPIYWWRKTGVPPITGSFSNELQRMILLTRMYQDRTLAMTLQRRTDSTT